jgi:hypothetical protein
MYSTIDSDRVINLKVVAKLKRGEKLNTRLQHYTIEPPGFLSPAALFRWIGGESRRQTIQALDSLVTSCIKQNHMSHEETMSLVEQMYQTSLGVENLMYTYKDDHTTVSGLELIMQKIKYFIESNGGYNAFESDGTPRDPDDIPLIEEEVTV